jgi:hypothetical protein
MKRIRKIKKGLDGVLMKRSIQEQLSREMKGMSPSERLAYIRRQVEESPFSNAVVHDD